MNVETIRIDQLSADPSNLRTHTDAQIEKLMASLRRWGQTLPLAIDKNAIVRIGNARLAAMSRLGWTECKVVRLDLPPSEWTALAIADNKLHDDSSFDHAALAGVLSALQAEDAALAEAAGYTPDEIAKLIGAEPDQPTAPSAFPEVNEQIEVQHECPRCHFKWSGSSAPTGEAA